MSSRNRAAAAATLLTVLVALAGCGSEDSTSTASDPTGSSASPDVSGAAPTTSPSPASEPATTGASDMPVALPACADVWVAGGTVPRGYEGCLDGNETVAADGRYCEFGKPLLTFQRSFYAVPGGPVQTIDQPMLKDPRYRDALRKCGG